MSGFNKCVVDGLIGAID